MKRPSAKFLKSQYLSSLCFCQWALLQTGVEAADVELIAAAAGQSVHRAE